MFIWQDVPKYVSEIFQATYTPIVYQSNWVTFKGKVTLSMSKVMSKFWLEAWNFVKIMQATRVLLMHKVLMQQSITSLLELRILFQM